MTASHFLLTEFARLILEVLKMRFQPIRDGGLIQAIQFLGDGLLPRRLIGQLHWRDARNPRAMDRRISKLCNDGWLARPSSHQYKTEPIPERFCWLGPKGILFIAGQVGIEVKEPANDSENQMRQLEKKLRSKGIRWLRKPRFKQLKHDIAVIDLRLSLQNGLEELPFLTLETWIPESAFRTDMDRVVYEVKGADGQLRKMDKGMRPDSYFEVVYEELRARGEKARAPYLLEYLTPDGFDVVRYGVEKVIAGVAYLKSFAYKKRFGHNAGRWLIISGSKTLRLENLIRETKKVAGQEDARSFIFTRFDLLQNAHNPITASIWLTVDSDEPGPLIT